MPAYVVGSIIVAMPAFAVAWLFLWRRHKPIFWFACAMVVVGVGYLASTGATGDIARRIAPNMIAPIVVVPAPAR